MIRSLLTLGILGALCGGALHFIYLWTAPNIEANRQQARHAVFRTLLPDTTDFRFADTAGIAGRCDQWLAATTVTAGYGGPMEFAYVVYPIAGALSIRIVHHRETPGFGDFVNGSWLSDRDGSTVTAWQTVDRVTGATITFNAVRAMAINTLATIDGHCRER